MGFDLSGMNPNITTPEPDLPPMMERTSEHWEAYNKWQDENCGVYFRNNVWWWRPLWDYVWELCGDCDEEDSFSLAADRVITWQQYREGQMNSGAEINVHQAELIALRLHHAIKMGWVEEYKEQYETDTADDEYQYPFNEENVRNFAEFCKDSGGFSIQ